MKKKTVLFSIFTLCLILSACRSEPPANTPAPTFSSPSITARPSPTAAAPTGTPAPTFTPPPGRAVLYAPSGSDPALADSLQPELEKLASGSGLQFDVLPALSKAELTKGLAIVVALPPAADVEELARSAPQVQFLAVDLAGLQAAANITLLQSDGTRPDEQGFIAGAIAALITTDWRVGVISVSDTDSGSAARQGFLNGVVYFCGLCRQIYPPYYKYPLSVELPAGSTPADWQGAAQFMVDHAVQTVYVTPGAGDEAMLTTLSEAGINMIGGQFPGGALSAHWVASLSADPLTAIQQAWPGLLQGQGGKIVAVPVALQDVNPDLFSPGRQRLAQKIITDLIGGFIETGVTPVTGENP